MIYVILLGAAAALVAGPAMWRVTPAALGPAQTLVTPGPTYQSAIADLANVRRRLVQTQRLDDAVKKAIDTLTLALVAGSDE